MRGTHRKLFPQFCSERRVDVGVMLSWKWKMWNLASLFYNLKIHLKWGSSSIQTWDIERRKRRGDSLKIFVKMEPMSLVILCHRRFWLPSFCPTTHIYFEFAPSLSCAFNFLLLCRLLYSPLVEVQIYFYNDFNCRVYEEYIYFEIF